MASSESRESHAGEAEHKKRRVGTPEKVYYSLSGETHAGVSSHLTGSGIPALQDYQRLQNPSTHSISSNYERENDLFDARETDFQQQSTYGTGSQAASQRHYHIQHYPANQNVPSNYERRSDSFETQRGNLPLQVTQEYSRNPIRSGVQAWPDHRQVETQTTPLHSEGLGTSSNTRQSGQMPRETSSDPTGTRIQAEQDYQRRRYSSNQTLAPTYGSQSDSFNPQQSNLPSRIKMGDSSGREIPAWQDHQTRRYSVTHRLQSHYESQSNPFNTSVPQPYLPQQITQGFPSNPTERLIQAGQYYQGQHYQATQGLPSLYGSEISSLNPVMNYPQITQGMSSHPTQTVREIQAIHSYQGQRYSVAETISSIAESDIDSLNSRQCDWSTQMTQGVLSNQWGRGIQAGQDYQKQYNPASQRIPSNEGVSSSPSMVGIETRRSYQTQHNTSTQTDPRGSCESRSDALDTEQPNCPGQATVGVSSDQTESGVEASQNNLEQLPTDERLSDSFAKKLYDLTQDITNAEFQNLKLLCRDILPRGKLDSLRCPGGLFNMLCDKNLLSESNTSLLEEMLCTIGLNALVGKYFNPSTSQEVSPRPRATETGQHPQSMTPSNFESRRYLSQVTNGVMSVKLSALVEYLKDKYKRHYSKLLPIPWNDDIHLDLHDVYTTLEVKKVKGLSLKMGEALENLHDMFKSASTCRRIRIEGAPAMGKSTLCRKLAYDWSCGELQQYTLLFFLEMRHIAKNNLIDEILNQLIPEDFALSKDEVSGLVSKNIKRVLFLCDGLDEPDECRVASSEIPRLISEDLYSWCTVVITTRPQLCNKYLNMCDLYLLVKGFTAKRTNEYILKYFKNKAKRGNLLIKEIKKQKESKASITDLLRNPLHVSFLCILWEYHKLEDDHFPETLTELYSEILDCILKRYCAKNKIELHDGELPQNILQDRNALALNSYSAYKNKKKSFERSDISSTASLDFGLLVKDLGHAIRKSKEIYFFYHLTWLEYFTALHILTELKSKNIEILNEIFEHPRKNFQILKFIAGIVTIEEGTLFFKLFGEKIKKLHETLRSLNPDCKKVRQTSTSLRHLYGYCIKCLLESKSPGNFIGSLDMLSTKSVIYSHGKINTVERKELMSFMALLDVGSYTSIMLDKECCGFQNFKHMLKLIGKTTIIPDTLCVLGFEGKNINSCLEILKEYPIQVKSHTIYSQTEWTLTDTDNLVVIIKHFRGESITLSLNGDAGNGGNNSGLKNVIERIKENTSVKCFKFEADQLDDILQTMTHNGTQEIVGIVSPGSSLTDASVNALCSFLENCDTTESLKLYCNLRRSDQILKIKTALMKISRSLKSLHFLYSYDQLYNALSANMTLNDIGMDISHRTDNESVCSVIKQNKYAKSMTIYDYYYDVTDEMYQSMVAALRENKVLKHLNIETNYDDNALIAMNNLLIPVSKEIETNQITLDSITLRTLIRQNSSDCTELQSIVSRQEKPDNWYHQVYPSVYSEYHYHLISYTNVC